MVCLQRKIIPFVFLLAMIGWLSACVNPQQVDLLERDQRRTRADMSKLQNDVDSFRATLADTRANMQQMQRDLSAIKEHIDETRVQVGRQIGQSSRDGDQRVKSLEARLGKLEEEAKSQASMVKSREDESNQLREELKELRDAALAAQQRPIVYEGFADIALGENEAVRKDYENAWRSYDKRDYQIAANRFRDFIKKNPRSRLAGAASFWLGESHFALKEYEKAIVAYDEVRRFAHSDKVAAALLRQGLAFAELGEKLNARLVLQELLEKFPQSAEAPRAKQRLKALES